VNLHITTSYHSNTRLAPGHTTCYTPGLLLYQGTEYSVSIAYYTVILQLHCVNFHRHECILEPNKYS
jgi:hypothetical protein